MFTCSQCGEKRYTGRGLFFHYLIDHKYEKDDAYDHAGFDMSNSPGGKSHESAVVQVENYNKTLELSGYALSEERKRQYSRAKYG